MDNFKSMNQLINQCINRLDKNAAAHRNKAAHKAGIAEARRIMAQPSKRIAHG